MLFLLSLGFSKTCINKVKDDDDVPGKGDPNFNGMDQGTTVDSDLSLHSPFAMSVLCNTSNLLIISEKHRSYNRALTQYKQDNISDYLIPLFIELL